MPREKENEEEANGELKGKEDLVLYVVAVGSGNLQIFIRN
jgi:hypothetical protein